MSVIKACIVVGLCAMLQGGCAFAQGISVPGLGKNRVGNCLIGTEVYQLSRHNCDNATKQYMVKLSIAAQREAMGDLELLITNKCTQGQADYSACTYHEYVMAEKQREAAVKLGQTALNLQEKDAQRAHADKLHKRESLLSGVGLALDLYTVIRRPRGSGQAVGNVINVGGNVLKSGKGGCVHTATDSEGNCAQSTASIGDTNATIIIGDGNQGNVDGTFSGTLEQAKDLGRTSPVYDPAENAVVTDNPVSNDTNDISVLDDIL